MPALHFCAHLTKVIIFSFQLRQILYGKMQIQEFHAPGLNFYSNQLSLAPSQHITLHFICKCIETVQLWSPLWWEWAELQMLQKGFIANGQINSPGKNPFYSFSESLPHAFCFVLAVLFYYSQCYKASLKKRGTKKMLMLCNNDKTAVLLCCYSNDLRKVVKNVLSSNWPQVWTRQLTVSWVIVTGKNEHP